MKVMCIDDNFLIKDGNEPKIGEVVTVIDICEINKGNYILSEYPVSKNGIPLCFIPNRFIPLSDIDETELVKQRESELVNQ